RVPTYKSKSLSILQNNFTYREIKNNIVVQSKRLTEEEVCYLFDVRAQELLKSVEIIHCSIHNLSSQDYVFSPHNEGFSPLSVNEVMRLIKTSSIGRMATGIVGGTGISLSANV